MFASPNFPLNDDPGRRRYRGTRAFTEPILAAAGLPAGLADALDDASLDAVIGRETEEARGLEDH